MILLIDNYDSFTFNLCRYLRQLGQEVQVCRNDAEDLRSDLSYAKAIIISPGPKAPVDAGLSVEIVKRYSGRIPILGVCLGHQVICEALGGRTVRASRPLHGQSSLIHLKPSRLFEGIPSPTHFARYHSLVTCPAQLSDWLQVTGLSDQDNEIMAVEHKEHITFGVQFHPESILSSEGHRLIQNFLACTGQSFRSELPNSDLTHPEQVHAPTSTEIVDEATDAYPLPIPIPLSRR